MEMGLSEGRMGEGGKGRAGGRKWRAGGRKGRAGGGNRGEGVEILLQQQA